MRVWCPGLMHVQRPGGYVAVCGLCGREVLFVACVAILTCVAGLKFLARLVCPQWFPALVPALDCAPANASP